MRSPTSHAVSAAVLIAALAASPPARADDDARAREVACQDFEAGLQQLRGGDLEGARLSFTKSFATWPTIDTLRNLAAAEAGTGHCIDALAHLREYSKSPDADRVFVQTRLPHLEERCNQQVGHLRIIAAAESSVTVDGRRVTDLQELVHVRPGVHTVMAKTTGHEDARYIELQSGQTAELIFPASVHPNGGPGSSHDGRAHDALDTASHQVGMPNALGSPVPRDRPGTAGDFWNARRITGASLAAAGVALAAVGLGHFAQAAGAENAAKTIRAGLGPSGCTVQPQPSSCSELEADYSTQNSAVNTGRVLVTVGGAAAVLGTVLLLWPSPRESSRAAFAPMVLGPGGGVELRGAF
jgi:hypothetical protein